MSRNPNSALAKLADELSTTDQRPMQLRISTITAVQASTGRKVQTDATGTSWLNRSEDTSLAVGDRVWLLQQDAVFIVGGRLSGEPGAVPIGALMPFASTTAPPGWLVCDGSIISRTTYATLFATIGTNFGVGDGSTTFTIPDLRGRMALGVSGSHGIATSGGAESTTLSQAQLAAHTHTAGVGTAAATVASGTGASVANATAVTTSSIGSGSSVPTISPFLAVQYIIRAL